MNDGHLNSNDNYNYNEKQESSYKEKGNNTYDSSRKVGCNDKNEFKTKEEMIGQI